MPFNSVMAKQPFFDRYASLTRTHYAGRQTEFRANVFAFDTRKCALTNKHDAHITTALSPLGSIGVCQSQQQYFSATRPDALTAFLQEITRVSTQSSMPFVRSANAEMFIFYDSLVWGNFCKQQCQNYE